MKIERVILENFRSYKDRTEISFSDFTALIGKNEAGKSSVLDALEYFFEGSKPDRGDANKDGNPRQVRIGVVFRKLPEELTLDRGAQSTLAAEHLLNADGELEIIKVFNLDAQRPGAPKVFAHAVHPNREEIKGLILKNNTELKNIVREYGLEANCNLTENPSMRQAIYAHFDDLGLVTQEVPLSDDNGKAIWEAIRSRLPVFTLFRSDRPSNDQDSEVQDPMKAAISKALSEIQQELNDITDEVRKRVVETAERTLDQMRSAYPDVTRSLTPEFRPPSWQNVFKIDLESDDGVPLNKRGSGVRRLILLSFFQAEAEKRQSSQRTRSR